MLSSLSFWEEGKEGHMFFLGLPPYPLNSDSYRAGKSEAYANCHSLYPRGLCNTEWEMCVSRTHMCPFYKKNVRYIPGILKITGPQWNSLFYFINFFLSLSQSGLWPHYLLGHLSLETWAIFNFPSFQSTAISVTKFTPPRWFSKHPSLLLPPPGVSSYHLEPEQLVS